MCIELVKLIMVYPLHHYQTKLWCCTILNCILCHLSFHFMLSQPFTSVSAITFSIPSLPCSSFCIYHLPSDLWGFFTQSISTSNWRVIGLPLYIITYTFSLYTTMYASFFSYIYILFWIFDRLFLLYLRINIC